MTWIASQTFFGLLVFAAIGVAAVGAGVLVVLVVRDWRGGRLW